MPTIHGALLGTIVLSACGASTAGFDGHYVFTRTSGGEKLAIRQRYVLSIANGEAKLTISSSTAQKPIPNDLDRAWFENPSDLHFQGSVKRDAATIVLDLVSTERASRPQWICTRIETHVFAARTPPACVSTPTATPAMLEVLSCREEPQSDTPPRDRGEETVRDANRWTFTTDPGLELITDSCASVLRRAR